MPHAQTRELFYFNDLSDRAKETARAWWRSCENQDFETDFLYDDFASVAAILGIEFDQRPVKLMSGATRYDPTIFWSGFSSQGDGACFEGSYRYATNCKAKIREYAPQDTQLHDIADALAGAQKPNFYRLAAHIVHRGHYYHEGCTTIDVFDTEDNYRDIGEGTEDSIREALRDFMRWIYRQLESEYEYRMSDENVDESIRANEYEFDESGNIA